MTPERKRILAIKLGEHRYNAGISLGQLADKAKISLKTVADIQDAKTDPLPGDLLKIANALDTTIADMLGLPVVRKAQP